MHILRARLAGGHESGFTLIELLMVLVIIAVLLAIAFPSYVGFKERAERRAAAANLRSAVPAVETYFLQNGSYDGMDLAALNGINASVGNDGTNGVFIVSAAGDDYCISSVKGDSTYYKDGPGDPITVAACT
jgi:prepilin-type N-terminal cleavage/methylation domain-containing protein